MSSKALNAFKGLLITLVTATAITGVSIIDDHIWNVIIAIVGVVAYAVVGILYSLHMIGGKEAGKEAYAAVFIVLLIVGVLIYNGILRVEEWILSWPIYVKVLILSIMVAGIIAVTTILIFNVVKRKKADQLRTNQSI